MMNRTTIIKVFASLLPFTPVTADLMDTGTDNGTEDDNTQYEDYEGPTMEEEVDAHNSGTPTIEGLESINVQVGDDFDPLAGVYAIDNQEDDITDQIEVTDDNVDTSSAGNYTVSYRVENSRGGWFEYTRQITVSESESDPIPQIPPTEEELDGSSSDGTSEESSDSEAVQFNGIDDITISQGDDFDPQEGVTILDTDGTDLSNTAYISGEVDTSEPGEYTIAYAVFDLFGDPHANARTVTVE